MVFLPNLLSISRIILIPIYINLFLKGEFLIAGILFSLSAVSDFFDGYIARKYNSVTDLGRILDPLADKLTIISILFALIYSSLFPNYIAIILLVREFFILISSIASFLMGFDVINASMIGKTSMFILYIAIAMHILSYKSFSMYLFYIVIPLNIGSGIHYVHTTIRDLSDKKRI
ncbi:CDP-diacylglycerol--glycerol-3-phosphate 3-phosphatidyltransferase [Natronospora cellulosivora (SeqCode)]